MTDVVSRPPVAETDPAPDHGLRSRLAGAYLTWLPLLLIAFGIALRLRQYASRRSLWLDEAYLSLSITDFDYGELSSRLLYDQAAPLGYLWAAKTSVLLIGNNEYALRLPALLAGVAALFLTWRLARRLLSAWLVPAAVGLVAVWPKLVYYSDEAKPYGVDVFAVLLVLWLTARWAEASRSRRTAVVWGLTAGIAIFFSFAALFAAAAGGLAIAVKALLSRDGRRIVDTALAGAVLGALLAVVYVVTIRVAAGNDVVRSAWLSGYAPLPLRARTYASWLADMATGFMTDPLEVQLTVVGLLLLALGVVAVVARRRTVGLAVLLVPLVVLAAATVQAYPVLLRFILFLVPLALIVMTAARAQAVAAAGERGRVGAVGGRSGGDRGAAGPRWGRSPRAADDRHRDPRDLRAGCRGCATGRRRRPAHRRGGDIPVLRRTARPAAGRGGLHAAAAGLRRPGATGQAALL